MPSTSYTLAYFKDGESPEMSSAQDASTETGRAALHTEFDAALDDSAASIAVLREPPTPETAVDQLGVSMWSVVKTAVRGIDPPASAVDFDVTEFFPINVMAGSTPPSPHATGFPNIKNVTLTVTIEPDA